MTESTPARTTPDNPGLPATDGELRQQLADTIRALGKSETELARLRADIASCRAQQWPQRLGAAEKTLNSVRALVDECEARGHGSGYPLTVTRIRAELDEPGPA